MVLSFGLPLQTNEKCDAKGIIRDENDETDSKECRIQKCLSGPSSCETPALMVNLTILRHAAWSPRGLCSSALRRQAWPKLVAAHQILLKQQNIDDNDDQHVFPLKPTISSDAKTKQQLRQWVQKVKWSKHSPLMRVESSLSLDLSVASPISLSLSPSVVPPRQNNHGSRARSASKAGGNCHQATKKFRHKRQVSFELDILANEEQETLVELLQHLQRCHPHGIIHSGTVDRLAFLWHVLESPSLTSIISLQLFQYHWQESLYSSGTDAATVVFYDQLHGMDKDLCLHFSTFFSRGDAGSTPSMPASIQGSWIPYWMTKDIHDSQLLARLWDVLLSSHPLAML
jgi:hypothetical protein